MAKSYRQTWLLGIHGWLVAAFATSIVLATGLSTVSSATARPAPLELRVAASYALPGEPSAATDVRWADDASVYVSRLFDGVAQLKLQAGLPAVRQVVPNQTTLGTTYYKTFSRLAASEDFLAFADRLDYVNWRALGNSSDGTVRFDRKAMDYVEDLDVAGDRLLVLGAVSSGLPGARKLAAGGAVAFLGSARHDGGQRFKPVLFDPGGDGSPHLQHCGTAALGAARFLADGSFFIVPGFQPGAHLFSREGAMVRTWNTSLLGLDIDSECGSMTLERRNDLLRNPEKRTEWLNRHRTVDEVLPLPSGPGVVVRRPEAGGVSWELDVLGAHEVETYEIPLRGSIYARLRGDSRDGKLVFLVADDTQLHPAAKHAAARLVVMEFPNH